MPTDFLKSYLEYSTKNEAPYMFHVWGGYTALSTAIGRRVWFVDGEDAIYPNIYTMLIANAGGGKSYALEMMEGLLNELGDISMTYDVETVEGMIRYIAGEPKKKVPVISATRRERMGRSGKFEFCHELLLIANEFIDFIRVNPSGWTGFLNNIYAKKSGYKYRTKNGEGTNEDVIPGPYLTLFAAIPTEISTKLQDIDIITTGFARRCIMQYGKRQFNNPFPRPLFGDVEKAAKADALARLRRIREFSGELKETPEAALWWDGWYVDHSKSLEQRATPATLGWLSSKAMQVRKIAILTSLSHRDDLLITPQEYELALGWLEKMEEGFPMIFGGIGRNELAGLVVRVLEFVSKQPKPVGPKRLTQEFFTQMTAGSGFKELYEILEHLVNKGDLATANLYRKDTNETGAVWATPAVLAKFVAEHAQAVAKPNASTLPLSTKGLKVEGNP